MSSTSYEIGKLVGQNKVISALIVAFVSISIYGIATEPEEKQQKPNAHAAADDALAVSLSKSLDVMCGVELPGRVERAKESMRKGDFNIAYALIDPCSARFERGSDLHALHLEIAKGVGRRVDKEIAEQKRLDAIEKKRQLVEAKKHGVRLGMTALQVLQSSWGNPQKVNRTINIHGTREQWVYGGGSYLYLQDGVLISIQD